MVVVVCRPSTLACTFYSLTSLAASHSPSFPLPLFYLLYVSPSSSFFSFSTLFRSISFSLSIFLLLLVPSFPSPPHRSTLQARQSFSFFLRAASFCPFLSLLSCICSPRGFQAIRAFLSHFHITPVLPSRSCSCGFLKADLERS